MKESNTQSKVVKAAKIKNFIKNHSYFWWWVPEDKKENLSIEAVVEATLNYGDTNDIKELFDIIGIEKVAELFFKQISYNRNNYSRRTANFFRLYFERHAQRSSYRKSN